MPAYPLACCRGGLMGAGNVAAVLANWRHRLSDQAGFTLVQMALVSLDADSPPRYWGGRDLLVASGLGQGLPPDPGHKADCRCVVCTRRRGLFRRHMRVMKELADKGAVARVGAGRAGRNAVYELLLHPGQGGSADHPQGGRGDHLQGGPQVHPGWSPGPPRGVRDEDGGTGIGLGEPEPGTSPGLVDASEPRCSHGELIGWTRDGSPRCPLCRRDIAAG